MSRSLVGILASICLAGPALAQDGDWRVIPDDRLLVVDTNRGRILAELYPEAAPGHVERIITLAERGFYDGVIFHRVIDTFMAQTGDPTGTGMGDSDLPDLAAEFTFRRGDALPFVAVGEAAAGRPVPGVMGALPIMTQPDAQMMITQDFRVDATPQFCPGVLGMARSEPPDSANSQFFFMRGNGANLNGGYTAFGRVVMGQEVVMAIRVGDGSNGEVTTNPDRMTQVRLASSLPEDERPRVRVARPGGAVFQAAVEAARVAVGARFTVCDVVVPAELVE